MDTKFYFLSPVEVVKVTVNNLEEVAEWCGGRVAKTESRKVKGRMDSYVWVPTPKDTAISWAFPGMYITKRLVLTVKDDLRVTWAVFRKEYFENNYFDTPDDASEKTWGREFGKKGPKGKKVHTQKTPMAMVKQKGTDRIVKIHIDEDRDESLEQGADPEPTVIDNIEVRNLSLDAEPNAFGESIQHVTQS